MGGSALLPPRPGYHDSSAADGTADATIYLEDKRECVFPLRSRRGCWPCSPSAPQPAAPADDAATLKVVQYPELMRTVRDLQGKVVVVDFWADW